MRERPMEQRMNPPIRFLRLPEVQARTGLSRSTIYVRLAQGASPGRSHWAGAPWAGSRRRWTVGSANGSPRAGSRAPGPESATRPRPRSPRLVGGRPRPTRFVESASSTGAEYEPVSRV